MNKIISGESWRRVRGDRGQKRSKINLNEFEKAEGEFENLYRFLEERYGITRKKAKEEVDRRIRK